MEVNRQHYKTTVNGHKLDVFFASFAVKKRKLNRKGHKETFNTFQPSKIMTFKQFIIPFCFSLSFLVILGCGGASDPRHKDLVPASGTLFYKGEPLGGATIIFHNEDSSKQGGSTMSETNGTFSLRTYAGSGTYPGDYTVTVSKEEILNPISPEEVERLEAEGKEVPTQQTRSLLPAKYRAKTTSDLKFTIPAGGDRNLRIELTD